MVLTEDTLVSFLERGEARGAIADIAAGTPLLVLPAAFAQRWLAESGSHETLGDHAGQTLFKVWKSNCGHNSYSKWATQVEIDELKLDQAMDLLLDENNHILVRGEDKTAAFRKKSVPYALLVHLLERRGASNFQALHEAWKKITKKGDMPSRSVPGSHPIIGNRRIATLKRSLRYLNNLLEGLGLDLKVFSSICDRTIVASPAVRLGLIRRPD